MKATNPFVIYTLIIGLVIALITDGVYYVICYRASFRIQDLVRDSICCAAAYVLTGWSGLAPLQVEESCGRGRDRLDGSTVFGPDTDLLAGINVQRIYLVICPWRNRGSQCLKVPLRFISSDSLSVGGLVARSL